MSCLSHLNAKYRQKIKNAGIEIRLKPTDLFILFYSFIYFCEDENMIVIFCQSGMKYMYIGAGKFIKWGGGAQMFK